jgi:hypothetical protein
MVLNMNSCPGVVRRIAEKSRNMWALVEVERMIPDYGQAMAGCLDPSSAAGGLAWQAG